MIIRSCNITFDLYYLSYHTASEWRELYRLAREGTEPQASQAKT